MLVKTYGSAVYGINATTVTVETNINAGVNFLMVGLPDSAVKESQQRIAAALKNNGLKVHLETSGAYTYSGDFDWICLSPKKMQPPLDLIKPITNELKVIVNNKHDLIWAEEQSKGLSKDCKLYLQAEWSKRELIIPMIIDFVKVNTKWTISLQSHKYMNIP